MSLSLSSKLFGIGLTGMALTAAVGMLAYSQFLKITRNQASLTTAQSGLRNQLEADMMHDALRADVFDALRVAPHKDKEEKHNVTNNLNEHVTIFRDRVKENQILKLTPPVREALDAVREPSEDYIHSAEDLVKIVFEDQGSSEAQLKVFLAKFKTLEETMEKLSSVIEQNAEQFAKSNEALTSSFSRTILTAIACSSAVMLILSTLAARSIARPLQKLAGQITAFSNNLSGAAVEISEATRRLAEGASEQAASLEETSATMEEMASMTSRNAESAATGSGLGRQTKQSAGAGLDQINQMRQTLASVKSAVGEMESAVTEMTNSNHQVAKIIKTIDEIAFQTNILALNAAVEAARAGEAGAGFAVVADEVRALAQRSALAAADTSDKIEAASKRSELGRAASTKVVLSLAEMESNSEDIGKSFHGIVSQIATLDETMSQIASASQEQSKGSSEVNAAVTQLEAITMTNAANAEQNSSSSAELTHQAIALHKVAEELEGLITGQPAKTSESSDTSQPPLQTRLPLSPVGSHQPTHTTLRAPQKRTSQVGC